ncbi:MAG TPA: 3-hydroxyacyl-ACP dehydratase FabZ [Firmicutes bacterium]|jgi:beta-hydroxyacyl-ACP dehydratase FabZ|uniref:3-hydroxyacyl-[acyl-carrier-protein] dehydratase FabZ n=1 Tax=candidate division TA06 bacterium TaxID=2250710 RepID=A0A660S942_UNCT6|nr:3-hydroxyacyl-ACP dehydratase FabZ [candidate division WOR-3 bacterium]RKX65654.1 MAG: 3-hydroxyacyl-[acyl-carrier-protein] dehydratase FabZ [candidate division TA06 bacterium]HFD05042.1 3-hydroxyacyl-ACP dehydratase FabZ [Bacillota bacterium]
MDIYEIMEMLPHRYPFLLVDRILEADKKHVKALKNVTMNEPFFQGHFPGKPVMPGVLIIESMAQSAVALIVNYIDNPKDYLFYFMKIDKVKFRKPVIPGDTLIHEITLEKERGTMVVIKGKSYVNEKLVCEGELTAMAVKREDK